MRNVLATLSFILSREVMVWFDIAVRKIVQLFTEWQLKRNQASSICHVQDRCGQLAIQNAILSEENALLSLGAIVKPICTSRNHRNPAIIPSTRSALSSSCQTSLTQHPSQNHGWQQIGRQTPSRASVSRMLVPHFWPSLKWDSNRSAPPPRPRHPGRKKCSYKAWRNPPARHVWTFPFE